MRRLLRLRQSFSIILFSEFGRRLLPLLIQHNIGGSRKLPIPVAIKINLRFHAGQEDQVFRDGQKTFPVMLSLTGRIGGGKVIHSVVVTLFFNEGRDLIPKCLGLVSGSRDRNRIRRRIVTANEKHNDPQRDEKPMMTSHASTSAIGSP